ncbi:MAG: HAD-IA family hydrolase [Acidimicrobiia bacterium]|nr:HAD-IA family hydrolase [Acidimicrobiia bacterium]MDH5519696.1 HAD-IA family hydrolase [Acidimicrobiia bacterium]
MTVAGGGSGAGTPITVVLFDMGGVLVELGSLPELLGSTIDAERFWPRWLSSPAVRRFERGHCSSDEFAAGAVDDLDLEISPATFLANFARFPRGLFPGAEELVTELMATVEIGVLSNTNQLHWETQPDAEILQRMVTRPYLSYRLGEVKPDEALFRLVLDDLDRPATEVLFLDDNQINVDGARRVGMAAETVKGPGQARKVLGRYGLVL